MNSNILYNDELFIAVQSDNFDKSAWIKNNSCIMVIFLTISILIFVLINMQKTTKFLAETCSRNKEIAFLFH